LELADIPEDLAVLIEDDITTDTDIIHSLKLISELSPVLYRELIVQARNTEEGGISRGRVRDALKVARGQTPPNALPKAQASIQAGQGSAQKAATDDVEDTVGVVNGQQQVTAGETSDAKENISHAKSNEQQIAKDTDDVNSEDDASSLEGKTPAVVPVTSTVQPKAKDAKDKIGKNETVMIARDQLVIGVAVCFATKILHGELLTDRVFGEPNKGWVRVLDGGKQHTKLVALDDITITSMAALAPLT
jgi:ParB family chromosome partitioning protein